VIAEAETTPLPKITVVEESAPPPPTPVRRSMWSRIGDLPMRVIYRGAAAVVAVAVAAAVALVAFVLREQPGEVTSGPIAAPSVLPPSPGSPSLGAPPGPAGVPGAGPGATGHEGGSGVAATDGPATPLQAVPAQTAPVQSAPVQTAPPQAGSPTSSATEAATPLEHPEPGTAGEPTAIEAALADPRVPGAPKTRRLARLPGKVLPGKRRVTDRRTGLTLPRLGRPWRAAKASPFATRQVLPRAKGAGHRALLVTCPVPIEVQDELRDTALLAARWTLDHQPKGAKIRWVASQRISVGKRDGWLLGYRTQYKVKGKKRSSMAAVALVEAPAGRAGRKTGPALVFVSIPDAQRSRWRDINTVMSRLGAR
jgi:hypothetical protein